MERGGVSAPTSPEAKRSSVAGAASQGIVIERLEKTGSSGHDDSERRSRSGSDSEELVDVTCCSVFWQLMGLFCYFGCPPLPENITRKIAFHPPPRKQNYRLMGVTKIGQITEVLDLKKVAELRELWIQPVLPEHMKNVDMEHYKWLRQNATTFVLDTKQKNQLLCIWVRSPLARTGRVILFSQGNSSDLGNLIHPNRDSLLAMSIYYSADVVAYDYSGFGYSTGSPSEKNIYADVQAVYDHIKKEYGEYVEIILMGYSMGTAASIDLASKRPENLVGLVLVAPFTSGMRLVRQKPHDAKAGFLDRFLSFEKAPRINVPTLIVHGRRDEVVPIEHSYALHSRLTKPVTPLYVRNHDHFSIFGVRQPLVAHRISHFIRSETAADTNSTDSAS
ncbi:hypothetical protein QR680_014249 [Steinernema hermaphroditum]|uniref:Serine aminopeptidase S33 domain-containing protein n=1 Tax=Steinernema hermaphroditum TaxID=289476 RepID=A0AA39I9L3_9BILA|nr:hypothetical protein QR680_014249 [Steinernema hermaphroditum]